MSRSAEMKQWRVVDSNFLGLMDLWVRIFWVGLNFLMVGGFNFFGLMGLWVNGFASVMDF